MRVTALCRLSKSFTVRMPVAEAIQQAPQDSDRPRLMQCECRTCGTHIKTVAAQEIDASCPNCGDWRTVGVDDADAILAAAL